VTIDDDLLQEAKAVALASGRTLTDLVEEALREKLARRREGRARTREPMPTFKGTGVFPGVDRNDSAALLDLMERSDAAT